ncbi:hypothetical protein BYT27DRAFT_7200790 [Phlegmacium glaucopus]|nr:hypothetical protein BYT27DRAFT_7200790 [Phlegmacium glaucopus]
MTSSARIVQVDLDSSWFSKLSGVETRVCSVWGDIIEVFPVAVENIVFRINIIFKEIRSVLSAMSASFSVSGSEKSSRVTIQASSILSTFSFAVAEVSPLFAFAFDFPFCLGPCPSFPPPGAQQSAA